MCRALAWCPTKESGEIRLGNRKARLRDLLSFPVAKTNGVSTLRIRRRHLDIRKNVFRWTGGDHVGAWKVACARVRGCHANARTCLPQEPVWQLLGHEVGHSHMLSPQLEVAGSTSGLRYSWMQASEHLHQKAGNTTQGGSKSSMEQVRMGCTSLTLPRGPLPLRSVSAREALLQALSHCTVQPPTQKTITRKKLSTGY